MNCKFNTIRITLACLTASIAAATDLKTEGAQIYPNVDLSAALQPENQPRLAAPDEVADIVLLPDAEPRQVPAANMPAGAFQTHAEDIGYVRDFERERMPGWPWRLLPDGSGYVARVEFISPGSYGLRLKLRGLSDRSGVEARVYDPAGSRVFGPYRAPQHVEEDGGWWMPSIFGDAIGIELFAPEIPENEPQLTRVLYYNCECAFSPGTPLSCHNDISCYSSWKSAEGSAVARITFPSGGGCGACTGALLNRNFNDGSPLFMTANHCVSTHGEAGSAEFFWFYETASCNGVAPNPNDVPRTFGAQLLKRRSSADFTLLGLREVPPSGFRCGWDSSGWNASTGQGVHHPRGSFKRISFGTEEGSDNETFCDSNGNCFSADVWQVDFTDGTTEPGSSGSPIFQTVSGNRYIMGTLTGGDSGCPTTSKFYGRFDLAYAHTQFYLNNVSSTVQVLSWAGDSGDNGALEQGSVALPFNEVWDAAFAVQSGGTVAIAPGQYNEFPRIWRPMTLTVNGSGVARIGN